MSITKFEYETSNRQVLEFIMYYEQDRLVLDTDYQRSVVWSVEKQIKYIEAILQNVPTPPIFWHRSDNLVEIVDGKQRLTSIINFYNNKFPVFDKLYSEFENKNDFTNCTIPSALIIKTNKKDVLELYIALNTGGTAHTEEEIEKAKKLLKLYE